MTQEKVNISNEIKDKEQEQNMLILFNDEVNTFDYVIDSLVEICKHDPMQAENCALIAHYKGKCSVKKGSFSELEPYHAALSDRQLTVEIQ